jgi:hypothetical protein
VLIVPSTIPLREVWKHQSSGGSASQQACAGAYYKGLIMPSMATQLRHHHGHPLLLSMLLLLLLALLLLLLLPAGTGVSWLVQRLKNKPLKLFQQARQEAAEGRLHVESAAVLKKIYR